MLFNALLSSISTTSIIGIIAVLGKTHYGFSVYAKAFSLCFIGTLLIDLYFGL